MIIYPKYVTKFPYEIETIVTDSDLIQVYKRLVGGTFLEQDIVPIVNIPALPRHFTIYLTQMHVSIEDMLLHEIAHAIQLKKINYDRIASNSLFKFPKQKSSGLYLPRSLEPTQLECEVAGIQLYLMEYLGYTVDHNVYFKDIIESFYQALPDCSADYEEICQHLIRAFYLIWRERYDLIVLRFSNYCRYVDCLNHL